MPEPFVRQSAFSRLAPLLAALTACGPPAASVPATQPDSALRAELVRLGTEDQSAREGFGAAIARNDTVYAQRLLQGDSARTMRLREIVELHGWPTPQLVGMDGTNAAWLILQHTPDTAFRRGLIPALDSAATRGDIPARDFATMTDRILVESGRPQRYGSSFAIEDGRMVPHPIEDVQRVDERRAAVGLPPMVEYVELLKEMYKLPVDWPPKR